ncbi:MAG: A/G-specific adenine glycosylase [Burkholderiales bacterium]|nr:A/G-specific adenine glycosylase [Burkholderiales bacterium]
MAKANKGVPLARPDDLWARVERLHPDLSRRLVAWQAQNGRHDLPWQNTRDPYRVWLSEIMLQQTQVTTVLGYYERFLQRFPTVRDLAQAPLDDVLTLWAGLGYYSRARNLHRCAQAVVADHGGQFPQTVEQLVTLSGIGPSTAAAIASFCFEVRTSIMDGNVKRVLSRVLAWDQDLAVKTHERQLWDAANHLVPEQAKDMPAYTQGLMDLGATVCSPRKPSCLVCPWADWCGARLQDEPERFPVKSRKLKRSERESWPLWLEWSGQVWLEQMPDTGVWAGLWTLPLMQDAQALQALATLSKGAAVEPQPRIKHVLTHLDWWLNTQRQVLTQAPSEALSHALQQRSAGGRWVSLDELHTVGLPAPFKKMLVG